MLDDSIGREIGGHHIKVTVANGHLHVWIEHHAVAQIVHRANLLPDKARVLCLPVAVDLAAEQLVFQRCINAEMLSQLCVNTGAEQPINGGQRGVRSLVGDAIGKGIYRR